MSGKECNIVVVVVSDDGSEWGKVDKDRDDGGEHFNHEANLPLALN